MENYTEREVKTSIRRLNSAISDIVTASYATYRAKIKSFVELSYSDPIINSIVEPFRTIDVDFNKIHGDTMGGWVHEVKLPTDINKRIAYIIHLFDKESQKARTLEGLAFTIYQDRKIESNIRNFLYDIAKPQLVELIHMLDDLIEDEVQGQQSIPESALQIINHGTITAHHGSSIALGKDIQQTISYNSGNIANEIVAKAKIEGVIPEGKTFEVEELANEVQNEIEKDEPSPGKLKQLAGKIYDIGEQGLLKVFTTIVTDPRWGQVAAETLMNI